MTSRSLRFAFCLLAIACLTGPPVQAQVTVLEVNWNPIEKNVKSLLFENILPFWFPRRSTPFMGDTT